MKSPSLRSLQLALLAAAVGLTACKKPMTYVHVKILPAAAGEPAPITDIELKLDLAGKTTSLHLTNGASPIQFPTDVTLEVKTGSGQLAIVAIARNAAGAEVDRTTTTVQVNNGAIAEAALQLPGGKPDLQPTEAQFDFHTVTAGQVSPGINVAFQNVGFVPSGPATVALGGVGAAQFTIGTDSCTGVKVAAGASCTVNVVFQPVISGAIAATVTVSATPGGSAVVALTGTGSPNPQAVNIGLVGSGQGTITSSPTGLTCGAAMCSGTFDYGTAVTLTPAPATGSHFVSWGGVCSGTGTCTATMTQARQATAQFDLDQELLTVAPSGNGSITSTDALISCTGTGTGCSASYAYGSSVTLTATGGTGSHFSSWSDPVCGPANPCTLTLTAAKSVTANFSLNLRNVTVTLSGTGAGTMASGETPTPNLSCAWSAGAQTGTCTTQYLYGSSFTVTATPNPVTSFQAAGAITGAAYNCTGSSCTVTVADTDIGISLTFNLNPEALTTATNGSGSLQCTVNGGASGACATSYNYGDNVVITATASTGSTFAGWTGDCTTTTGTCTLSMTAAHSVTAKFTLNAEALTVNTNGGNGTGTVQCTANGVGPAACATSYNYGTSLVLTPTASSPSSTFSGWSGICINTAGNCTFTITAATTATAKFTLVPEALTIKSSGNGAGTFQCALNGGTNGTCATSYNYGDSVVITATPNTGSNFTSWTGCSSTVTNTCTMTMTAAQTGTATFTLQTESLVVNTNGGNGTGTVSCSVNGTAFASCPASVTYGDKVVFIAAPNTGSSWSSWAGCSSSTATCTLASVTAPTTVTATFASNMCAASVTAVQTYSASMAGCGGASTFANRANVCLAGAHVCTADEYVEYNAGTAPTHVYWTDDVLNPPQGSGTCGTGGCASGNCFATVLSDPTYTSGCGAGNSMAVCNGATDAQGNGCSAQGCGYTSIAPNEFIGGCVKTNTTASLGISAGTLCCAGNSRVLYVDAAIGNDANAGTTAAPFKTITHALGLAQSKQQVRVKPGTYNATLGETFPISVPAGVILTGDEVRRGSGTTPTSIVGCGTVTATLTSGSSTTGAVAVAAGATVAGFTITCSSGSGLVLTGSGTNIRTNTIAGNNAVGFFAGVMVANTTNNHVIDLNSLTNNYVAIWYNTSAAGGKGENNTITANQYGVVYQAPGGDLGNPTSPTTSVGNNTLSCNTNTDLYCNAPVTANVASNRWDHSPPHVSTTFGGGADIYNPTSGSCTFNVGTSSVNPNGCVGCSPASSTSTASTAQIYNGVMAGCGGSVTQPNSSALCAQNCHVCSSSEYVNNNGAVGPNRHYWVSDQLFWYGTAPGDCSASPTNSSGNSCGTFPGISMLVCTGVTTNLSNQDADGNKCNWSHCGYGTNGLGSLNGGFDEFLGGCPTSNVSNTGITAGTLCCCP